MPINTSRFSKPLVSLVTTAAGVYLSACATQSPPSTSPSTSGSATQNAAAGAQPSAMSTTRYFRCGITPVSLTVEGDAAALSVAGNNFKLNRQTVASGTLWGVGGGDTGVTFWDQGEQAVLKVGMRNYPPCDRVAGK